MEIPKALRMKPIEDVETLSFFMQRQSVGNLIGLKCHYEGENDVLVGMVAILNPGVYGSGEMSPFLGEATIRGEVLDLGEGCYFDVQLGESSPVELPTSRDPACGLVVGGDGVYLRIMEGHGIQAGARYVNLSTGKIELNLGGQSSGYPFWGQWELQKERFKYDMKNTVLLRYPAAS